MAWIESITQPPLEPFNLSFIPKSEREFQEWLFIPTNWSLIFSFNLWVREYHFSKNCKVDFVGCDWELRQGYLVELKTGGFKNNHALQVNRYLRKIANSKSWTNKVTWHGLLLRCKNDLVYFNYIGRQDAISQP